MPCLSGYQFLLILQVCKEVSERTDAEVRKHTEVRVPSLRHTFATNLVNGQKQPDGTIRALSPRQVADLLGHSTSQITELYYVKKDTSRLNGITEGFEI